MIAPEPGRPGCWRRWLEAGADVGRRATSPPVRLGGRLILRQWSDRRLGAFQLAHGQGLTGGL